MKKYIILLLLLSNSLINFAQNRHIEFDNLTINKGLSQSVVRSVYVDSTGIAWIGTDDGLNRYDGYDYEIFKNQEDNPFSLSNIGVRLIWFEDSYKNLWILTADGLLNKFNLKTKLTNNYGSEIPDSIGFNQFFKRKYIEDNQSNIWFCSRTGLFKYIRNKDTLIAYQTELGNENSIPTNNVFNFIIDKEKNLWIGTMNGISRYLPETDDFKNYIVSEDNNLLNSVFNFHSDSDDNIYALGANGFWTYNKQKDDFIYTEMQIANRNITRQWTHLDKKNNLWFGFSNGLYRYDIKTEKISSYVNEPENEKSISNNIIRTIYESELDELWIGTQNGLNKYNYQSDNFTSYFRETENNYTNIVSSITEDFENKIWLTHNINNVGARISLFDPKTEIFTDILTNPIFNTSISLDYTLVNFFINDKTLPYKDIFNNIWFGSFGGGVSKYQPIVKNFETYLHDPLEENSIPAGGVWGFIQDKNGIIWTSIVNYGLVGIDNKTGQIADRFPGNMNDVNGLRSQWITSMDVDKNGEIWLTTTIFGLNKFNPYTKKVVHFSNNANNSNSVSSDNRVRYLIVNSKNHVWLAVDNIGIDVYDIDNDKFEHIILTQNAQDSLNVNFVSQMYEDSNNNIWIMGNAVQKYDLNTKKFTTFPTDSDGVNGFKANDIYSCVEDKNNNMWFATTGHGFCKYSAKENTFKYYDESDGLCNNFVYNIVEDNDGYLWLSTNFGISKFDPKNEIFKNFSVNNGLQSNEFNANAYFKADDGKIYFGGISGISAFYPNKITIDDYSPSIILSNLQISEKDVNALTPNLYHLLDSENSNKLIKYNDNYYLSGILEYVDTLIISYKEKTFSFLMTGIGNLNPKENIYKYKLENFEDDWHFSGNRRFVSYSNLPHGEYVFVAYAGNSDGVWSKDPVKLHIIITPPIWKTLWFRISIMLIISILMYLLYKLKIKRIEKKNQELEKEVEKRSGEIIEKNEELLQQQQEILAQSEVLEDANRIISNKNKNIVDSINYASNIQEALLPPKTQINTVFPENFILFRPRDIVSGDFFWFRNINDSIIYLVADCTGHGVPGAFMSMLGIAFLNEIVRRSDITSSNQVLDVLRDRVKQALGQKGDFSENQDGMDIGIVVINKITKKLQFSGAYRALLLFREKELQTIKGDRMPIGIYRKEVPFTKTEIQLQNNDSFYLFTDGYPDQFNKTDRSKFSMLRFKKLLTEIQDKTMNNQKSFLNQTLEDWKGASKQLDDILVVGFKIDLDIIV